MSIHTPFLLNRNGTYYLRVVATKQQQANGAKRETWRSLQTKDRKEAKILALSFALQKAQAQMPSMPQMPYSDFVRELKHTAPDGESLDFDPANPAEAAYAKDWKQGKDIEIEKLRAQAAAQGRELTMREAIGGRIMTPEALTQYLTPTKPQKRLKQAVEDYFKLYGTALDPRTAQKYRSNIKRFIEWAGDTITVDEVTADKWIEFKLYLATSDPAKGRKALSPKTIDLYTNSMANVLKVSKDLSRVLTGQLLVKKAQREKDKATNGAKHMFTPDELIKIFDPVRMNAILNPMDFWGVLIALLTGARLNEIFQLRVADVRIVEGVRVFDIQEITEGNNLKTMSSPRLIPVHETLLNLGLLDYLEDVLSLPNASKLTLLFPFLNRYEQGYGDVPSQRFTALLQDLGIHKPRFKTFHSMRHTVNQKLKEGRVSREWREMLLGQKSDREYVNDGYGGKAPIAALKDMALPALTFDEIKWQDIKPNRERMKHVLARETAMRVRADAIKARRKADQITGS